MALIVVKLRGTVPKKSKTTTHVATIHSSAGDLEVDGFEVIKKQPKSTVKGHHPCATVKEVLDEDDILLGQDRGSESESPEEDAGKREEVNPDEELGKIIYLGAKWM